jgi:hypothetical protein
VRRPVNIEQHIFFRIICVRLCWCQQPSPRISCPIGKDAHNETVSQVAIVLCHVRDSLIFYFLFFFIFPIHFFSYHQRRRESYGSQPTTDALNTHSSQLGRQQAEQIQHSTPSRDQYVRRARCCGPVRCHRAGHQQRCLPKCHCGPPGQTD